MTELLTLSLIVQSHAFFFTSVSVALLFNCLFNVSDDSVVSKFVHALYSIAGVSHNTYFQVSTHLLKKEKM